jgi:GNAT superfamily N-acetyltransferase
MQPPLRQLSRFSAAFHDDDVVGVAGVFHGFGEPSVSVAADAADIADALFARVAPSTGLMVASVGQPLPAWSERVKWSVDPWFVADCIEAREEGTHQALDPEELRRFYREANALYWCPAMLEFGGSRIIRDQFGNIAGAASVLFVLPDLGYAHIGGVVTAPPYRRQGFARKLLADVRTSLARAGVGTCGLFADAAHPWLVDVYERFGFSRAGLFRLGDLSKVNASRIRRIE